MVKLIKKMLKIVSNQRRLLGIFLLLFGLFFYKVKQAEAVIICDSTDGVNCCATWSTVGIPFGCSNNCGIDPYCVTCTGSTDICSEYYICDPECEDVPPPSPSPIVFCPDGSCNNGETCNSCPSDCGSCSSCPNGSCGSGENCSNCPADCGSCPAVIADVKANGSDTNITVAAPYIVSWTSANANICTLNGSTVATSGNLNYSYLSGTRPYDLICNGVGSPDTDTVSVTVDCSILTADVKANGSDTDITTFDPYTISWSSANASSCTLNGSAVNLSGNQLVLAITNGTYPYDLVCSTSICDDTDNVNVTVNFCGNGTCAGFENCSLCAADCGACPTAWWQVAGGSLFSAITSGDAIISDIAGSITCIEPSCVPGLSILDSGLNPNSDGFPVTGGGAINQNGQMITYRNPDVFAIGTTATRLYENYSYFYSKYSLGLSPFDDYTGSAGDALKPVTSKDAYFHSGNMTIQSPWDVASDESYVVFVDGDLNIEDPLADGELIKVAEGGFLAFIVSGDININENVGHSVLANTAANIEGVYIADGMITVASNGTADKKFIGEGSFVGWTGVGIARTYDELTSDNDFYPAETFVYRPDFVKNTPEKMKRAQMLWQETN